MSASQCIKCERVVSMYQKYCPECVAAYGVQQDDSWHKNHWFVDWNTERLAEFERDLAAAKPRTQSPAPLPAKITLERSQVMRYGECGCGCCHDPDYGACDHFEAGFNSRCVYCDHGESCHPGTGLYHNGPLGAIRRNAQKAVHPQVLRRQALLLQREAKNKVKSAKKNQKRKQRRQRSNGHADNSGSDHPAA